jgi:hypothetical protein
MLRTRDAIMRRTAVQTTLLLLSIVAALVVGLLAMHTFTSSMSNQDESASTMSAATMGAATMGADATPHSTLAMGEHAAALTHCSADCGFDPSMSGMMCVLALLFTALCLMAATAAKAITFGQRARQSLSRMIAFAAFPAGPPPDLNALSISRT